MDDVLTQIATLYEYATWATCAALKPDPKSLVTPAECRAFALECRIRVRKLEATLRKP